MSTTRVHACRGAAAWLLAAALLSGAPAWAQADTAENRRGVAEALVNMVNELSAPDRALKLMKAGMQDGMLTAIRTTPGLTPEQQQRAADVLSSEMSSAVTDMLKAVMPGLNTAMTEVRVQRFSLAELQELQRFYVSDAGRKSMTVRVEDTARTVQPMMHSFQSQAPRLQERLEAAMARLKAERIEPPKRRP